MSGEPRTLWLSAVSEMTESPAWLSPELTL